MMRLDTKLVPFSRWSGRCKIVAGEEDRAVQRLAAFYGPLAPPPDDPFAFYLWEVLGTGTTPGRRDAALSATRLRRVLLPSAGSKR